MLFDNMFLGPYQVMKLPLKGFSIANCKTVIENLWGDIQAIE